MQIYAGIYKMWATKRSGLVFLGPPYTLSQKLTFTGVQRADDFSAAETIETVADVDVKPRVGLLRQTAAHHINSRLLSIDIITTALSVRVCSKRQNGMQRNKR